MNEPDQLFNRPELRERRRDLRKQPTAPEQRFWRAVRSQQLGVKFRRQQGIGPYIVDFYCAECALVVELDGDSHFQDRALAYDRERDDFLRAKGLTVLRFTNEQVMREMDGILIRVLERARSTD